MTYIPFGLEWKNEMAKLRKSEIIDMLANKAIDFEAEKAHAKILAYEELLLEIDESVYFECYNYIEDKILELTGHAHGLNPGEQAEADRYWKRMEGLT